MPDPNELMIAALRGQPGQSDSISSLLQQESMLPLPPEPRESLYGRGVEMLKEQMTPVYSQHDYVPSYSQFNDQPTDQELRRQQTEPLYDKLKVQEYLMQKRLMNPMMPMTSYPPGYNSNDRT